MTAAATTVDRDQLVREHMNLAFHLAANQLHPGHHGFDDILSAAYGGLLLAAERFEPERGFAFVTYARHVIRGAILDTQRHNSPLTRGDQALLLLIDRTRRRIAVRDQRLPSDETLAAELGWTPRRLSDVRARLMRGGRRIGLDDPITFAPEQPGEGTIADVVADKRAAQEMLHVDLEPDRQLLATALATLSERERLVLALYYWEDCTLREIGAVLGVTESRVSQLHTRALSRLRTMIPADTMEAA